MLNGMSKLTTHTKPLMSRPRDATSVATKTPWGSARNLLSAASRSLCFMSPCNSVILSKSSANTSNKACTTAFSRAKISVRLLSMVGGKDIRISRKAIFFFSMSWHIRICCVTFLLATLRCALLTTSIIASVVNSRASPSTPSSQVALNIAVCLSGRVWRMHARVCGTKPMLSILSASSSTTYVTFRKVISSASKMSISRPGVATATSTPCISATHWSILDLSPP
mmetsp:Transcript_128011/g.221188  ORF Transcript_128011/g.221188 Transcript_128011/m.221188 type:complete len:225 (+) Transcript_128011:222-896(+)